MTSSQLRVAGGAAAWVEQYCEDPTVAAKAAASAGSGPPSSLGSGLPRKDTDVLIAELFEEEGGAEGRSGSGLSAAASLGIVQAQSAVGLVGPAAAVTGGSSGGAAAPPPPPPPPGNARHKIQREMEELREELRDGQSQWEVHEQIGKGGFGVVYKVSGGGVGGAETGAKVGCGSSYFGQTRCGDGTMTKPLSFSRTGRGLQVAIKRVIFQVGWCSASRGQPPWVGTLVQCHSIHEWLLHLLLPLHTATVILPPIPACMCSVL